MTAKLDFSNLKHDEFSLHKCSDLYDEYLATHQNTPSKIYVRLYQANILSVDRAPLLGKTWRGVPLEIK